MNDDAWRLAPARRARHALPCFPDRLGRALRTAEGESLSRQISAIAKKLDGSTRERNVQEKESGRVSCLADH
jgi:hypothetical protein